MYYTQEQIDRANQADLVSFLQSQGEQLTRAGNEYRWKRHDSLTVRGNKWYRHSQSKGGGPVDFVMEFFGKSFTEAVELLTGEKGAVPPPDRPCPASLSDFRLPPPNSDNCIRAIQEAGLPLPGKLSCFFCPGMKRDEVEALKRQHPDLYRRALAIEENAMPHLKTVKGLGRNYAWKERYGME